jgi:HEPN domain
MSKLRVNDDDHPMAATKHLRDAEALLAAGRPDGSAYHSGYVVECSLKAVLLHDEAWDAAKGRHDSQRLAARHRVLSRPPFGHDLARLTTELVNLASLQIGAIGAKYLPDFRSVANQRASVLAWKETIRYAAEDPDVNGATVRALGHLEWAMYVHEFTIAEMFLDGVL